MDTKGSSERNGSKTAPVVATRSATVSLARTGRELRHLVWMKMLCSATPEVRRLVIAYVRLDREVKAWLPDREG